MSRGWEYTTNARDYAGIAVYGREVGYIEMDAGGAWAGIRTVGDKPSHLGHFVYKLDAAEAVADNRESGHMIQVRKFNAGGHPVAGWNWPVWGYKVICDCGFNTGNVAGETREIVREHLKGN